MRMSDQSGDMYNVPLTSDSDAGDLSLRGNTFTNPTDPQNNMITSSSVDSDLNGDEEEEKQRLITQVLELQNTLDDLSSRVDTVKEENLKLKSENQVLGQYIENLMAASSVFQSTSPKSKKKSSKKKEK
ncbi:short coiled-coil protein B-like isoform X2 [Mercenaria mercenaria]|uniref:short coiled-coil protein B-like isoform X2 n=1 Tax=Mercenaria mercenaria TaxID=6596 RepID=UPI001E1DB490|nr:short coiled-coil protein B-like isoform X2 [Mercenaria mercenaria]